MKKVLLVLVIVLFVPFITQVNILQILKLKTFDALVSELQPSDYFTI